MGTLFTLKEYLYPSYKKFLVIERINDKKFSSYNEYFKLISTTKLNSSTIKILPFFILFEIGSLIIINTFACSKEFNSI